MVDLAEISANVLLTSKLCVELQNGYLAAIQRKISLENSFEFKPEVTTPLNCKPPASNRTLKTLELVTSEANFQTVWFNRSSRNILNAVPPSASSKIRCLADGISFTP